MLNILNWATDCHLWQNDQSFISNALTHRVITIYYPNQCNLVEQTRGAVAHAHRFTQGAFFLVGDRVRCVGREAEYGLAGHAVYVFVAPLRLYNNVVKVLPMQK